LSARGWYTRVPSGAFRRITGEATFPAALAPFMDGDALGYLCNVEMSYRIAGVTARVGARWELSAPPDGGDTYRAVARGTRATVVLEQGPETGGRRRLFVEPRGEIEPAVQALGAAVAGWQTDLPGVEIEREDPGSIAIVIPPALSAGHEAHFALVLDGLLQAIDDGGWPAAQAARTLAKYALLAEAAAAVSPPSD
jgi:hypothetical protein